MTQNLENLDVLIGEWTTEATHPMLPDVVVSGGATFQWLGDRQFLIYRSQAEHPQFPDSISVIGAGNDELEMQYFDSRGVHRVYLGGFKDGVWTLHRDDPDMAQRFAGTLAADGASIDGLWQTRREDGGWDDDLAITYRRAT